ncbi:transglutaminase-like enzyme, predicted cysteine protease [Beggiatoa alba B18LD]|uniref:Transglutaminase-like enzyme, predicted cysteine protease n=1 Tax=Beggiatoa alba B18LD TaxID=395493 RepID=I3CHD2_9GAMM|nr:transglutaminase-like domain-containing protein [Beggiatoa alba]EIJ43025.1 transglutaminase-like enzyme, predicted cysteine protease [Beggiatoa alba B18LD]
MQKTLPPFLLGISILFWGWQSQLLFLAIPMAILIEMARWVEWRWDLSDKEFNRLSDLTSFLWVGLAIYLFSRESIHGLFTLLNWLPPLFFLLLATQQYSTVGSIRVSSILVSMRRMDDKKQPQDILRINICYPYIMLCLLAASTERNSGFFIGIFCLMGWSLWAIRPIHYERKRWFAVLFLVGGIGFLGQLGLYQLQQEIEKLVIQWFEYELLADRDPYRQTTAIGDIQGLKQSEQILLRVDAPYPLLLREASYNVYIDTTWRAQFLSFSKLEPNPNPPKHTWTFTPVVENVPRAEKLQVARYMNYGKGMLALPLGTFAIAQLPALLVEYNRYGAVRVSDAPEWVNYRVNFNTQHSTLDTPPTDNDLIVPATEAPLLKQLVAQLQLEQQTPTEAINTVTRYFTNHYRYTLKREASQHPEVSALGDFLLYQQQGHCEYFATATALLLRAANIPTRYAAGFAVEEYSDFEKRYVVRQRHAHAWTLAYINGQWIDVDTTPADWSTLEAEQTPWWQTLNDVGSWIWFQFTAWRWQESSDNEHWFVWLLIPLFILLIWRLAIKNRVKRQTGNAHLLQQLPAVHYQGEDSAFYQITEHLQQLGYERACGETLQTWLNRLPYPVLQTAELQALFQLHQRYRFDPQRLNTEEKQQFTTAVAQWLQHYQTQLIPLSPPSTNIDAR